MEKETTAIRLKKIMNDRNLRQVDILNLADPFCKQYDVKMNKSDISQYCAGKTEPNQNKLFVLGKALDVSEAWLMGYDVPMERVKKNISFETPDPNNEINIILTKVQKGEQLSTSEKKKFYDHLNKAWPQLFKSFKAFGDTLAEAHLKKSFDHLSNDNKLKVINYSQNLYLIQQAEEEQQHIMPDAAHQRTDISQEELNDETRNRHDDDIMNDPNF